MRTLKAWGNGRSGTFFWITPVHVSNAIFPDVASATFSSESLSVNEEPRE